MKRDVTHGEVRTDSPDRRATLCNSARARVCRDLEFRGWLQCVLTRLGTRSNFTPRVAMMSLIVVAAQDWDRRCVCATIQKIFLGADKNYTFDAVTSNFRLIPSCIDFIVFAREWAIAYTTKIAKKVLLFCRSCLSLTYVSECERFYESATVLSKLFLYFYCNVILQNYNTDIKV